MGLNAQRAWAKALPIRSEWRRLRESTITYELTPPCSDTPPSQAWARNPRHRQLHVRVYSTVACVWRACIHKLHACVGVRLSSAARYCNPQPICDRSQKEHMSCPPQHARKTTVLRACVGCDIKGCYVRHTMRAHARHAPYIGCRIAWAVPCWHGTENQ